METVEGLTEILGELQFQDVFRQTLEKVQLVLDNLYDYMLRLREWELGELKEPPCLDEFIKDLEKCVDSRKEGQITFFKVQRKEETTPKIELF